MATTRERLAEILPVFALEVRTPRLTLRFPDDDDTVDLARLAADGIHDPDTMPFLTPWTRAPSPHLERNSIEFLWTQRCTLLGDAWHLTLATVVDDEIVGVQSLVTGGWKGTRTIETGSWLGVAHQGRGIGTEMRLAALHLAFDGFGAWMAVTEAFADNPASIGVTRALGYQPAGTRFDPRDGEPARTAQFSLERDGFDRIRRDDIELVGVEPVLAMFGSKWDPASPPVDQSTGTVPA